MKVLLTALLVGSLSLAIGCGNAMNEEEDVFLSDQDIAASINADEESYGTTCALVYFWIYGSGCVGQTSTWRLNKCASWSSTCGTNTMDTWCYEDRNVSYGSYKYLGNAHWIYDGWTHECARSNYQTKATYCSSNNALKCYCYCKS